MKIRTNQTWSKGKIRGLCIKENWYTMGDNEEYMAMWDFVGSHKPTPNNVYKVALDIMKHSDVEQSDEYLENIMFLISESCIMTFYEIER